MGDEVSDQILAIVFGHGLAIQVSGLHKIVIGMLEGVPARLSAQIVSMAIRWGVIR